MYCAGHLIQAAVALHRGAGDGRLLAVAVRLADHLVREFGGQDRGLDGHPVIETALAELYRETGTAAYLELARQFVDQRSHGLAGDSGLGRRYLQDDLPVRQSATEVGHVVRALYLEAGVTDVAVEMSERSLLESSARRWNDMVAAKTYLTGGNGSRHATEGFGDRFELPRTARTTRPAPPSPASSGAGGCCSPPETPSTRITWSASSTTASAPRSPPAASGSST